MIFCSPLLQRVVLEPPRHSCELWPFYSDKLSIFTCSDQFGIAHHLSLPLFLVLHVYLWCYLALRFGLWILQCLDRFMKSMFVLERPNKNNTALASDCLWLWYSCTLFDRISCDVICIQSRIWSHSISYWIAYVIIGSMVFWKKKKKKAILVKLKRADPWRLV